MENYHKYTPLQDKPTFEIPSSEIIFRAVRSSGPGGQKVNKTASKVELRWNVEGSSLFNDDQKALLFEKLASRINSEGELILTCETERSQLQNKTTAQKLLNTLVNEALEQPLERVPTRPTKAARQKRLDDKSKNAAKKKNRKTPTSWD